MTRDQAEALLAARGQGHLLRWFDTLDDAGRARLLRQIAGLDLTWLDRAAAAPPEVDPAALAPPPDPLPLVHPRDAEAIARGRAALAAGRAGVVLVAGGQGSRLGFDGPKGAFPLGPVSGRTLFEHHAHRLLALGARHGVVPPLYVMTSPANDAATRAFFRERGGLGLPPERLHIFPQGTAPVLDPAGRMLLDARDHVAVAPDGNGGLYAALAAGGALDHMAALGVESLAYVQVDNPLSPALDPRILGHHLLAGGEVTLLALPKRDPAEKVGCFARVAGRLAVVEYIHLPDHLARARREDGALAFGLANPGIFVFQRAFLARQARRRDLPVHRAFKAVPHLDDAGRRVEPEAPCAHKLETFVFDTLPDARDPLLMAGRREEVFAPVKNARGEDSPESARRLMSGLHRGWLAAAGAEVRGRPMVEIDARWALDAAEVRARLPLPFRVAGDCYIGPEGPAGAG